MPDGARRAAALRLLLGVVLVPLLVIGCVFDPRPEIVRVEQAVRELPGVESVEGDASFGDARVEVELSTSAEPAHAARTVREAADRLASMTGAEAENSVGVTHPDRPQVGVAGEFTASARSVPAGEVAAESMATDARAWFELAEAFPGAYVTVYQEHFVHSRYIRHVVVSLAPGAAPVAVSETFRVVLARPFAPAYAETVGIEVPGAGEPELGYAPRSSYTLVDTRAEAALRAFDALAAVQPAGPGAAARVLASATEDRFSGPRLDVDVSLALDEFAGLPADLVADRIPGSPAGAAAAAYREVLKVSGLPYELEVAVGGHPPFLEIGG